MRNTAGATQLSNLCWSEFIFQTTWHHLTLQYYSQVDREHIIYYWLNTILDEICPLINFISKRCTSRTWGFISNCYARFYWRGKLIYLRISIVHDVKEEKKKQTPIISQHRPSSLQQNYFWKKMQFGPNIYSTEAQAEWFHHSDVFH